VNEHEARAFREAYPNPPVIRPLRLGDAARCDEIIAGLPYHFGQEDGRRECAQAVRSQAGLVAVREHTVVGFLTVQRHFEHAAEITWRRCTPATAVTASAAPSSTGSARTWPPRDGACCWC
jgi:hypothetical protein